MGDARSVVLCADLGTGSLRVGAIAANGTVVATAATSIRATAPEPGWSAIDPEVWWRALARVVGRALDLPTDDILRLHIPNADPIVLGFNGSFKLVDAPDLYAGWNVEPDDNASTQRQK